MPSIGIENNLTLFLARKIKEGENWSDYVYDFLFFSANKNYLSEEELENVEDGTALIHTYATLVSVS